MMLQKLWWSLIGSVLLWMMPGSRPMLALTEAARQGGSLANCIIMADPMCESKAGRQITFNILMMNGFDQRRHFIVTQDMAGAMRFTLEPNAFVIQTITITVGTSNYRLHPKAWCRIFDENELTPAELLRTQVQIEVDKITKFRGTHAKTRGTIESLEQRLESTIATSFKMDKESAIQR